MDSIPSGSSQQSIPISRRELLVFYLMGDFNAHETRFQWLIAKVRELTHCEADLPNYIKQNLFNFINQYKQKWQSVSRSNTRFETKYHDWLDTSVHFPLQQKQSTSPGSVGRPQKDFVECSDRSKRRKTQDLRSTIGTKELTYAAEMKLRSEGNVQAAKVLADIGKNPDSVQNYVKKDDLNSGRLTKDKALSLLVNARLTKHQYNWRLNELLQEVKFYPNFTRRLLSEEIEFTCRI